MRVSIKPYACCRYNHAVIDGVLQLRREHALSPSDVRRVELGVLTAGAVLVAEPIESKRMPANVVDAQFSAPFAAAVALVRGEAGLSAYTLANIEDPDIRRLMAATDCYRDPKLDAAYPDHWPATVRLELNNGRRLQVKVDDASGEPANPVSTAALHGKFSELAGAVLDQSAVNELAQHILNLDREGDLDRTCVLLRG
jgi:2-methylcitrate dehydratase PrpD